jgi:LytR cell envelope-related transcriptional attenuator
MFRDPPVVLVRPGDRVASPSVPAPSPVSARMAIDPDSASRDRSPGARAWLRPAALVISCLVIGFIAGWVLRGDDGPATVLAPPAPEPAGQASGATTGGTTTAPPATAPETPAAPPARDEIRLAVLNATDVQGAAGRAADEAESLGYTGVTAGNAPTTTDPDTVYYREGQEAAAERVAGDLQVDQVTALPASGGLASAVPTDAEVVLVIGPG